MARDKSKAAPAAPVADATVPTPAATPAATPTPEAPAVAPVTPVATAVPHTKEELEANIALGLARGPLNGGGAIESLDGFKRLLAEHPEDKDAFLRDGNGNVCVFDLTAEKGKKAVLRRSAGPSKRWIVCRTSDLHQKRFWDGEKPKGSKRSSKALAPAAGVSLADLK